MSYSISGINQKMEQIREYILSQDMQVKNDDLRGAVIKFMKLKEHVGNLGNDIHFLTLNLAHSYILKTHGVAIDLTKNSGTSGLDIEAAEVIGEIKTTIPYMHSDFGAQQKHEIVKDLQRLEQTEKGSVPRNA